MICGIFSVVYSAMITLLAIQAILYTFAHNLGYELSSNDIYTNLRIVLAAFFGDDNPENIIAIGFTCLICATLALAFALASRNKGYKNKISMSGLVLGVVSLVIVVAFGVFAGYVYSTSEEKGAEVSVPGGGELSVYQNYINP